MQQKKQKIFNILITGDSNYNNVRKFNITVQNLLSQIDSKKMIFNFGQVYGAEILGRLYAQSQNIDYQAWQVETYFRGTSYSLSYAGLYHMMQGHAIKKADLVLIFSNKLTEKISRIINECEAQDTQYCLIKE